MIFVRGCWRKYTSNPNYYMIFEMKNDFGEGLLKKIYQQPQLLYDFWDEEWFLWGVAEENIPATPNNYMIFETKSDFCGGLLKKIYQQPQL